MCASEARALQGHGVKRVSAKELYLVTGNSVSSCSAIRYWDISHIVKSNSQLAFCI
jgi:hypothetical protein